MINATEYEQLQLLRWNREPDLQGSLCQVPHFGTVGIWNSVLEHDGCAWAVEVSSSVMRVANSWRPEVGGLPLACFRFVSS
jgi:hypothetical protein